MLCKRAIDSLLKLVDSENKKLKKALNKMQDLCIVLDKDFTSEVQRLRDIIATKDLFIDGQDKEIEKLKNSLDFYKMFSESQAKVMGDLQQEGKDHKKSMEALAKAGHSTGNLLNKEKQKTRILSLGIIAMAVVCTVSLWIK